MVSRATDPAALRRRSVGPSAGYTLLELMLALSIGVVLMGAALMVANQVTRASSTLASGSAAREEGQFAMDWVTTALRQAGSNPYATTVSACPAAGTVFTPIRLDPLSTGRSDNVRIHADTNPPNGLLGGAAGACIEADEDVTIAHDTQNLVITRQDNNLDRAAVPMSDRTITALRFEYLNDGRVQTVIGGQVVYVRVSITTRSGTRDQYLGQSNQSTLTTEVRVRLR